MKKAMSLCVTFFGCLFISTGAGAGVSDDSQACLDCHVSSTPGITAEWKKGRMAGTTPRMGQKRALRERRVSFDQLPEALADVVVGCAECHMVNPEKHEDTFDHNGYRVHVVVTPDDCATCHPTEAGQFQKNLMSEAHGNLQNNPLYQDLVKTVTGIQSFKDLKTILRDPDEQTLSSACLHCHGTSVRVLGTAERETAEGPMTFPVLSGWPNQGVGRLNPDGSKGSCAACHTRHQFSIAMARKPHTCSQCHKGPDVPAYKVYEVSKHGNIYSSLGKEWDFDSVPWTVGKDITAPTCATCHVSLLATQEGDLLAERTHQMNDRLAWRIMGLIYAHPHPKSPDTTIVKNKAGLPLPTELGGAPVSQYLIDKEEQDKRRTSMQKACLACHSRSWVDGHFALFESSLETTNEMTLAATNVLLSAWEKGAAKGPENQDSLFNESIEKKWVEQWLFFANSTRYSSAMMGADYGVFANGRWYLSKNIQEMVDWLEFKLKK